MGGSADEELCLSLSRRVHHPRRRRGGDHRGLCCVQHPVYNWSLWIICGTGQWFLSFVEVKPPSQSPPFPSLPVALSRGFPSEPSSLRVAVVTSSVPSSSGSESGRHLNALARPRGSIHLTAKKKKKCLRGAFCNHDPELDSGNIWGLWPPQGAEASGLLLMPHHSFLVLRATGGHETPPQRVRVMDRLCLAQGGGGRSGELVTPRKVPAPGGGKKEYLWPPPHTHT